MKRCAAHEPETCLGSLQVRSGRSGRKVLQICNNPADHPHCYGALFVAGGRNERCETFFIATTVGRGEIPFLRMEQPSFRWGAHLVSLTPTLWFVGAISANCVAVEITFVSYLAAPPKRRHFVRTAVCLFGTAEPN
jgi:hypothetical protein